MSSAGVVEWHEEMAWHGMVCICICVCFSCQLLPRVICWNREEVHGGRMAGQSSELCAGLGSGGRKKREEGDEEGRMIASRFHHDGMAAFD
mmetsp:Transcript_17310/g.48774  ORF Transcript_17310/g.48774 Transcript_17310/m.48774 type:complete len:91 (-) Transcript_17310:124-396(-)